MLHRKMIANPCFVKLLRARCYVLIAWSLALLGIVGCDRDPMIRVYDAPKDSVATPSVATAPTRFLIAIVPEGASAFFIKATDKPERLDSFVEPLRQIAAGFKLDDDRKPVWNLPDDWRVLPGSGITSAVIEAPMDDLPIRFTVTELPMPTDKGDLDGFLESNINRWRGQLGLPANTIMEQRPALLEVARGGELRPAYLFDLTGNSSGQPPMGMGNASSSTPAAKSPPKQDAIEPSPVQYKVPEGWKDQGPSGMRIASFFIGEESSKAEVTVIIAGGDRLSNVERWQGQLNPTGEADVNKASASKAIEEATKVESAKKIEGQLYSLLGPEGDDQQAMLAAILPSGRGDASVFVKLTGNARLAQENRDKLIAFISSLEW